MFSLQRMSNIVTLNRNAAKVTTSPLKSLKTIHMNTRLILFAVVIAGLSSCTTAYKTGQTPDDVYYSPERQGAEYVAASNDREDGRRYNNYQGSSNYYETRDDRYLRMMVRNRYRWSAFDDYYYMDGMMSPTMGYHSPWSYNSYNPWSFSFYNNFWSWNSFYNPYCSNVIILNPVKTPNYYNRIRNFNLAAYNTGAYSNTNSNTYRGKNFNRGALNPAYNGFGNPRYSNSNSGQRPSSLGTSVRKVFSNSNNSRNYEYNSSSDRPVRTYSPSNSNDRPSSSGNSGSSGGSSGGSRPSGSSSGGRPGRG